MERLKIRALVHSKDSRGNILTDPVYSFQEIFSSSCGTVNDHAVMSLGDFLNAQLLPNFGGGENAREVLIIREGSNDRLSILCKTIIT